MGKDCFTCDTQDAKVVTVFNMIAVPCFVYQVGSCRLACPHHLTQGAVGLLGERLYMLGGQ